MTGSPTWLSRATRLDTGLGARLVAEGLDLNIDDPCLWSIDRPEQVLHHHRRDFEAGAQAIVANTFGANAHRLDRLTRRHDLAAINRASVSLARSVVVAATDCCVIGSIGPESIHAPDAITEQAKTLIDAGVDALLIETVSTAEARIILSALDPLLPVPVLVSFRDLSPDDHDHLHWLLDRGPAALGVNCRSIADTGRLLHQLRRVFAGTLLARPGRMPSETPLDPDTWAESLRAAIPNGPVCLGGCCGVGPAEIMALSRTKRCPAPPSAC